MKRFFQSKAVIILAVMSLCSVCCSIHLTKKFIFRSKLSDCLHEEIVFPESLWHIRNMKAVDTLTAKACRYKVIVYIPQEECSVCYLNRLWEYSEAISALGAVNCPVWYILHFSPENRYEIEYNILRNKYPVDFLMDDNGDFALANPMFIEDQRFSGALLDENNNPVIIGNPLSNARILSLVLSYLHNR